MYIENEFGIAKAIRFHLKLVHTIVYISTSFRLQVNLVCKGSVVVE